MYSPLTYGFEEFQQRLKWKVEDGIDSWLKRGRKPIKMDVAEFDSLVDHILVQLFDMTAKDPKDIAHWEEKYKKNDS